VDRGIVSTFALNPAGVAVATASAVAAAGIATMVSIGGMALGVAAGAVVVGVVAAAPRKAVLIAIPLLMAPLNFTPGDINARTALAAALEVGVLLGQIRYLRQARSAIFLALPLAAMVLLSLYGNPPAMIIPRDAATNHAITLVLFVLLIPTFALARPGWPAAMGTLALSGTFLSMYSMAFGLWGGGRNQLNETINANATGHFAVVATMCCIVMAYLQRRPLWLIPAGLSLTEAVFSQSRGGFVALGIGLAVLWFVTRKKPTRGAYLFFAVGAGIAAWPILIWAQTALFSLRDPDYLEVDSRQQVARLAIKLAVQNPVKGIGYRGFLDHSYFDVGVAMDTHDDYLRIACECGLLAFGLLAAAILLAARSLLRGDRTTKIYAAALITSVSVFAFANTLTELRVSLPAWIFLGLALASSAGARPDPDSPPTDSAPESSSGQTNHESLSSLGPG
jgi:hypothetical protein